MSVKQETLLVAWRYWEETTLDVLVITLPWAKPVPRVAETGKLVRHTTIEDI